MCGSCSRLRAGQIVARPSTEDLRDESGRDWSNIGLRIAVTGSLYPFLVASGVFVAATCAACFDGTAVAPRSYGVLLQMLATFAAGFPYLLFSSCLLSVLIAVPLVAIAAQTVKHGPSPQSVRAVTAVGIVLIAAAWAILLYLAAIF
jgi:hypothetical protein